MLADSSIALSAACLGVAMAGALSALRGPQNGYARMYLTLVFVVFGCIVATPLVFGFALLLYGFYLPVVFVLLLALPAFVFFYVVAKTTELQTVAIRRRDIILPALGTFLMLGYWLQPADAKSMMFIEGELPEGIVPAVLVLTTFVLIFVWVASSSAYLIASLSQLRSYRLKLRSLLSNLDGRELRWLDWFIASLVALWSAAAFMTVAENTGFERFVSVELLYVLTACFLLFVLAFASIVPPQPWNEDPVELEAVSEPKYARSALTPAHAEQLATRIKLAMDKDALFLDPNLSLQKLSRHVGALPNQVSQTLNEQIGSSFFDFIAYHRVAAAKPLLQNGGASTLAVSLDVGFNSRSTFYKAFKRETGMTPKAYRAAAIQ